MPFLNGIFCIWTLDFYFEPGSFVRREVLERARKFNVSEFRKNLSGFGIFYKARKQVKILQIKMKIGKNDIGSN